MQDRIVKQQIPIYLNYPPKHNPSNNDSKIDIDKIGSKNDISFKKLG